MTFGFNFFFFFFSPQPRRLWRETSDSLYFYSQFQASLSHCLPSLPPPSPSILFLRSFQSTSPCWPPQHSSHSFTCWGFPLAGCAADTLQPEYGQHICVFLAADGPRMPNSVGFFLFLSLPSLLFLSLPSFPFLHSFI